MTQIVMLTGLAGNGIDIACGDVCVCTAPESERFIAARQARPFDATIDDGRRIKHLHQTSDKTPKVPAGDRKPKTPAGEPKPKAKEGDQTPEPDLSLIPTDQLLVADPKITPENVAALVAAGLTDVESVSKQTTTQLKKLDTLGAATLKRIRAAIASIRKAATEAAQTTTDDNHAQANEGATPKTDDAASK